MERRSFLGLAIAAILCPVKAILPKPKKEVAELSTEQITAILLKNQQMNLNGDMFSGEVRFSQMAFPLPYQPLRTNEIIKKIVQVEPLPQSNGLVYYLKEQHGKGT